MSSGKNVAVVGGLFLAGLAALGTAGAQGLNQANDNSMAALTNEVRQLRVAVQEAGRSQTQIQALSISLTAQQSRLSQVNERLDKVHAELSTVAAGIGEGRRMMAEAQAEMSSAQSATQREQANDMFTMFKARVDQLTDEENRLRTRELELMNQFRVDEQRWLELVARLEEIIKR